MCSIHLFSRRNCPHPTPGSYRKAIRLELTFNGIPPPLATFLMLLLFCLHPQDKISAVSLLIPSSPARGLASSFIDLIQLCITNFIMGNIRFISLSIKEHSCLLTLFVDSINYHLYYCDIYFNITIIFNSSYIFWQFFLNIFCQYIFF